ncbi:MULTISPECIES: TetR/AcrR family transcriptional regulator [Saccharopolyspora]|uniref:TetR/AcrR family transcriptional regulator n=1 Tax=Saccharopolyspora gregorii TaxID=33914 RepID=A0ABP6RS28_9PSEU|nr:MULTISPECIES: TetR/AcrR family transcriptional regulator [Saccharopolyspora]MCA1186741.1 TetR/AcrR family transcriptional regulator [Saccharopolyspora sp. 6T]MCA1196218.1 TetR/AcrR family transcriptional regulator [Saccharopolyspora sp. 6V]MCA1226597.1 TetR/AcrR family transcriptional regulator [Saccharopolyspora sp. 6M]MCA1278315.1 TetR/AcrR family transcriptional regulator [Saccharopolyspora sp. 7B]
MSTGAVNHRRADTRRNHELILAAAAESLTSCGEVSFNAIAKHAGVGVGTVYRHFPAPEDLILAVYQREVRHLVEVVPSLLENHPPEQAFRVWTTDHLAHYMMTKRGLANALSAATAARGELPKTAHEALVGSVATLLAANVEAGTVRAGLDPEVVLRGLGGLLFLDQRGPWRAQTEALIDLLWRGMSRCCGR